MAAKNVWEKAAAKRDALNESLATFTLAVDNKAPTETLAAHASAVAKDAAKLARSLSKIADAERAITERTF